MPHPTVQQHVPNWPIQEVETLEALMSIEAEWRTLEQQARDPSLFSTFDYIRIAWTHLHRENDSLFVLIVRESGRMLAIAPFRISHIPRRRIPIRTIDWLATWEGERPEILCVGDSTVYWARIERFFASEYRHWDELRLCEQRAAIDSNGELARVSWIDSAKDSIGFHISLAGSFDEYLGTIDSKVRSNWRNRSRKISILNPTPVVTRVGIAAMMPSTVDRFIAIERKSWKAEAGLGMGKDMRHRRFYAELTSLLAGRGQAAFYFLCCGDQDIAGSLLLICGNTIYERHIAHDPEYSALSPGIVLRTEILKEVFGKQWTKLDLMGMHPSIGRQRHKADWATGQWEGLSQHCYRKFGRATPIIAARSIRRWLHDILNGETKSEDNMAKQDQEKAAS